MSEPQKYDQWGPLVRQDAGRRDHWQTIEQETRHQGKEYWETDALLAAIGLDKEPTGTRTNKDES